MLVYTCIYKHALIACHVDCVCPNLVHRPCFILNYACRRVLFFNPQFTINIGPGDEARPGLSHNSTMRETFTAVGMDFTWNIIHVHVFPALDDPR